jgi:serine/threonine protein kinase
MSAIFRQHSSVYEHRNFYIFRIVSDKNVRTRTFAMSALKYVIIQVSTFELSANLDKLNKCYIESANEEELSDILREIELMKDLGKHENVIQMFGCCIRCRPICLVLEYAPGGNLKNYLRSLKKKVNTYQSASNGCNAEPSIFVRKPF